MAVRQLPKHLIVTDAVLMWSKMQVPVLKYGEDNVYEYSVEALIDEETKKALTKLKVNKQFKEAGEKYEEYEGLYILRLTQPKFARSGKELQKPVVFDQYQQPTTEEPGNGSKGQVKIFFQEGTGVSKGKLNLRLHSVFVQEWEEFSGGGNGLDGFDDAADGGEGFDDDDIAF